ncbi:MAG: T9SS type A sorting domain-containing protein [Ignavibacteriaceae bacterium]
MRRYLKLLLLIQFLILFSAVSIFGQYQKRQDAIWARTTSETITLDGVLDEASWAKADSIMLIYGQSAGLPTSGWANEFADAHYDSTHATVKFLAKDNQLYIAFIVPDSSICGAEWPGPAWWDGILLNVKNAKNTPASPSEIFLTWLFTTDTAGAYPRYGYNGLHREDRSAADMAKWDAGIVMNGTSNDDSTPDTGWVFEYRVSLDSLGYNSTQTNGDVVPLNFGLYDCDWYYAADASRRAVTRTWWQNNWGNNNLMGAATVMIRPDVTTESGDAPNIDPDVVIPNGASEPDPVIDGDLTEAAWMGAVSYNIFYDDMSLRSTYPGIGKYMSGWFEVAADPKPTVLDPGDANFKMFFKGDNLYLAADVNDALVQSSDAGQDGKDGVRFIVGLRDSVDADHKMVFIHLLADFDSLGNGRADEDLDTLVKLGYAELMVKVKGATTVNDKSDIDEGYTVELKLDLTKLGYPSGLGDHLLFGGVCLLDADSFDDPANNYGSRTWFFKESKGNAANAWMVMDENKLVGIDDHQASLIPNSIEIYGNYPNPFNPNTKIKYSIPNSGDVNLIIYNILGQQIAQKNLFNVQAGSNEFNFDASNLSSGVYLYKIKFRNNESAQLLQSKIDKMILMK